MQHPIHILERYWNFTTFKPLQEEIIQSVLEGNDTLALLPTGGGKSMCFQIPALAKEGICVVISPLVALMKNQVKSLQDKGIKAMALTSGISYNQLDTLLDNCIYGNYKFLYLSPERLQQDIVKQRIKQMNVNLIAVDEAHCISQWGNDFRPAYKNIDLLRQLQPHTNTIALTASATPLVVDNIIKELDFIQPKVFKQSFERENLAYMTFHEEDKLYKLEAILKKNKTASIIYVRNRKATLEIAGFLNKKGYKSTFYHGGLSNTEKDDRLENWLNNTFQIMVATNAFGMGIDKPDVKTVIHLNLPESIESYFQEAGRAGRNGKKAFAVILKNKSDEILVKNQFLSTLPTLAYIKTVYRKLSSYFQISYGEGHDQTFAFNFNTFCKTYKFNTVLTYNALQTLDRLSIINLSKQFNNQTRVRFIVNSDYLFKYLENKSDFNTLVKTLLRTYGGIFEQEIKINTFLIAEKTQLNEVQLITSLTQLKDDDILELEHSKMDAEITFIEPREDDKTINRIAHVIEQQNKLREQQVTSILNYINNDKLCKSVQLLSYFGEKTTKPCGICSVCIKLKDKTTVNISVIKEKIIKHLENGDQSSRAIVEQLSLSEKTTLIALQGLLEHNIIDLTKKNTYKLAHI